MTETHPEKRLFGYARVSTYGQTLDSQLAQLRKAGCTSRNIYREKVTGARPDRRELNRMLGKLVPGDVVTVTRIDRLARSTFDLFGIVKRIVDAKAQFRSLGEPWADSTSSTGRLMLAVLGGLADVERDLIRTRTAEGRSRAKAQGKQMGRPLPSPRRNRKRRSGGARRARRSLNWPGATTSGARRFHGFKGNGFHKKMAKQTNPEREFVVRFAVGKNRGLRSSVWRIWKARDKDDIYIAPRPVASFIKGSLHASGLCYFSVTSEHHAQMTAAGTAREKRAFTRWQRFPTPAAGLVKVVSILFAAEFLSKNFVPVERADTLLIHPPKLGEAIVIDLLFGLMAGSHLVPLPNQRELGRVRLSNGEEFLIISGLVNDFDAQRFQQRHQPAPATTEIGFFQELPHARPDDLRGAILLPAIKGGVLRIVEIGPAFIT